MKKILFPIYALPIYLLVLLPFPVFYLLSDFLFIIGYYVIGYRKQVIYTNLRNAFPEYSQHQLDKIVKKYYHFMIDTSIEAFKVLVMSPATIQKRVRITGWNELDSILKEQKPILFVMGHYGNWEWMGQALQLSGKIQIDTLYQPLSNSFFDWLILKTRSKYGIHLIPMKSSLKEMIKRQDIFTATIFLADQSPSNLEACHWMTFLNQDTPVFLGTEKIAKKLNRPVVFLRNKRIKRGYYETNFEVVTLTPQTTAESWITESHTRILEKDIAATPELWLWSHRRWKHKRTTE